MQTTHKIEKYLFIHSYDSSALCIRYVNAFIDTFTLVNYTRKHALTTAWSRTSMYTVLHPEHVFLSRHVVVSGWVWTLKVTKLTTTFWFDCTYMKSRSLSKFNGFYSKVLKLNSVHLIFFIGHSRNSKAYNIAQRFIIYCPLDFQNKVFISIFSAKHKATNSYFASRNKCYSIKCTIAHAPVWTIQSGYTFPFLGLACQSTAWAHSQ